MEEDSILGLGSELSSIHSSEGALSDPEGDLVGDPLEQVEEVGGTLNRVLQSFQRVEPTSRVSQQDTMSDMDSQGGGVIPWMQPPRLPLLPKSHQTHLSL